MSTYLSVLSNVPDQSVFRLSYPQSALTAEPPPSFDLEFGHIGDPNNPNDWALGPDPLSPPEATPHAEQQPLQDDQTLGVSDVVNFFNAFITDPHSNVEHNSTDPNTPEESQTLRVSSSSTVIVKPEEEDEPEGLYQPPSGASAGEKARSVGGCWGRRIPVPVDMEEDDAADSPIVEPQPWSVRAVS